MFHIGKLYRIQLLSGSQVKFCTETTTNHTPFTFTGGEFVMLLSVRKAPWKQYNIFGILNSEGYSGEVLMKPREMILVSSD